MENQTATHQVVDSRDSNNNGDPSGTGHLKDLEHCAYHWPIWPGEPELITFTPFQQVSVRFPNCSNRKLPLASQDGPSPYVARDDAQKKSFLTINQVEVKDSAVYYCSIDDSGVFFYNGKELMSFTDIQVQAVTHRQRQAPSLELFPPSRQEVTSAETVTLSCLIRGFYPAFGVILWKVRGSETQSGVYANLPHLESDNSDSVSSYLNLPIGAWNSNEHYSCLFRYKSQDTLVHTSISLETCGL
ncbi:immunoglobulin lambda-1 light chain-like [Mustelus asterias]